MPEKLILDWSKLPIKDIQDVCKVLSIIVREYYGSNSWVEKTLLIHKVNFHNINVPKHIIGRVLSKLSKQSRGHDFPISNESQKKIFVNDYFVAGIGIYYCDTDAVGEKLSVEDELVHHSYIFQNFTKDRLVNLEQTIHKLEKTIEEKQSPIKITILVDKNGLTLQDSPSKHYGLKLPTTRRKIFDYLSNRIASVSGDEIVRKLGVKTTGDVSRYSSDINKVFNKKIASVELIIAKGKPAMYSLNRQEIDYK